MIEIHELTKRYGSVTAVSGLTFTVRPGEVTGFLGPNGAGKSTTMRMIVGLDAPTSGTVLVNGKPPRAHAAPLRELGAMLDPRAVHPSRSACHHLLALTRTSGIRCGPWTSRASGGSAACSRTWPPAARPCSSRRT